MSVLLPFYLNPSHCSSGFYPSPRLVVPFLERLLSNRECDSPRRVNSVFSRSPVLLLLVTLTTDPPPLSLPTQFANRCNVLDPSELAPRILTPVIFLERRTNSQLVVPFTPNLLPFPSRLLDWVAVPLCAPIVAFDSKPWPSVISMR